MGLMFRRRRPVARLMVGAATAGVAYNAGRRRAQQDDDDGDDAQAEPAYDAGQTAPYIPPPEVAPTPQDPTSRDLEHLAHLHESGALTDDEFTAAKSRL